MKKIQVIGFGNNCPKCFKPMERRKHREKPKQNWFYTKWDYCLRCKHIQHYDEFKSNDWKENDERENIFKNL